jgi:hypothetical protein
MQFSLDFPEAFRASVIPSWAYSRKMCNWSMFIDHLDKRSRKMGSIASQALLDANLEFRTMEILRNNPDGFVNTSEKCLSCGSENILSWLAPMETLNLQQSLRSMGGTDINMVYGGEKDDMLLKSNGITVFSQEPPIKKDSGNSSDRYFGDKREIRMDPSESVKIKAALSWVSQALKLYVENGKPGDEKNMASCLQNTKRTSAGGFTVQLSPEKQCPSEKTIYVLESEQGRWIEKDKICVNYSRGGYVIEDR